MTFFSTDVDVGGGGGVNTRKHFWWGCAAGTLKPLPYTRLTEEGRLDCPKYRDNQLACRFFFAVFFIIVYLNYFKNSRILVLVISYRSFNYLLTISQKYNHVVFSMENRLSIDEVVVVEFTAKCRKMYFYGVFAILLCRTDEH